MNPFVIWIFYDIHTYTDCLVTLRTVLEIWRLFGSYCSQALLSQYVKLSKINIIIAIKKCLDGSKCQVNRICGFYLLQVHCGLQQ